MAFDGRDDIKIEVRGIAGDAKGAVLAEAAGACDLRDLMRIEPAQAPPSELRLAKATWSTSMFNPMPMASVATGTSSSPDWKRLTWALRVRELSEPHDYRRPATLAADKLGDGVDGVGGKGDKRHYAEGGGSTRPA